ncbi:3'-5' exoribonuclease YhaM family protein [Alkaliphilus transvaalensis]|uniref:3'-5' exoribonuclease YhaM family protein n=1 Tax=Alkaliphilus transvaalensis TaxID=114628 RepID=UPI000479DF41|nr:HD domain-containing protein [Alkaliphilus transvaalensis]
MEIKQLKDINKSHLNSLIEVVALLVEVKVRTTKTEKQYADLILQDASKKVEAKCWEYQENKNLFDSLLDTPVVKIKALVGEYQGQIQLTVKDICILETSEDMMAGLIPTSDWGLDTLQKGLQYFYEKVETPHLKTLLDKLIFNEDYYEKFITYPAARQVHHNFYHGLLQHVLEVLKFAFTIATTKKLTKRQQERLIVMAFLHDWAKIFEYKPLPNIGFTDEGTMLGHIFLGAHMALNTMDEITGFDQDDKLIILNGILGHHGKLEYGSPVLPKTVEAQILHHADCVSGDIESILSFMEEQENEEDSFTGKLWNMGTDYYKKGRY